jgi:GH15 family glucan-1,4-alpha-glucosidase
MDKTKGTTDTPDEAYPPISDYAMISDCRCAALISRDGSVDWCCMPRFDDDSCFGRLLDRVKGGYCSIRPADRTARRSRQYVARTMILETRFANDEGEAVLYDFFAMEESGDRPCFDHIRIVEGGRGEMDLEAIVVPRFDYGEIRPHIRRVGRETLILTGSNKGLIIHADLQLDVIEHHRLEARFRIRAGERRYLLMRFEFPDQIDESGHGDLPDAAEIERRFERTRDWWTAWADRAQASFEIDALTMRSLITLKSLTYEPTGAIIAAPTTSLPEAVGGQRNWDYRYSWIRDSVFVVQVLEQMGYAAEADRFHRFIERSSAGSAAQLQIMYGIDGKRRLDEIELDWLEGYRGSRPVRIGNRAARQMQSDIYGELLLMAWQWHAGGHRADADYWAFLHSVIDTVCQRWQEPDHGIWELRDKPRHFVHSKAMCWAALDRGIALAQDVGVTVPLAHWREVREQIRTAIESRGYSAGHGTFVQSFDSPHLDAALLLLPRIGFVAYDDPRMVRTVDAICSELDGNGLLRRYKAPDGLPDDEGTFLPCTFWAATCLARQGKMEDAWRYYRAAADCANDVGLLSEEFDLKAHIMLGNFPQALTHVSQIAARIALAGGDERDHR